MKDYKRIAQLMREDWDRRIRHDFRFWMSDGYQDDRTMWETGARDLDIILRDTPPSSTGTFLEVGCGVGRLLRAAGARFESVIGVDISQEALERAKTLLADVTNVKLVLGSGIDLYAIPENSVDVVVVFAALSSVPTDVFARYLTEIQRVLTPGGIGRIQVYTGVEQQVGSEDTLHIRSYNEKRLEEAAEMAGFSGVSFRDFELPVDVSIESIGVKAKILCVTKGAKPRSDSEIIARSLLPQGESSGKNLDGDIEYWMALNFAKTLVESGDTHRARQALEYAVTMSKAVTIDVADLLQRIVSEIEKRERNAGSTCSTDYYSANFELLKQRFPYVATALEETNSAGPAAVTVESTPEGPVLLLNGQHLDHPEKPVAAGRGWAKRALQEKRLEECEAISVVGIGCGYHIEALLEETTKRISVLEPRTDVFRAFLTYRDARAVIERAESIKIGDEVFEPENAELSELVVRPQSLVVYGDEVPRIKEKFYGLRGLRSLKPNILVVGPLQGGTLPIMGYTHRGLLALNQRSRDLDMSAFNAGYGAIASTLKDTARLQAMHANHLELMSQMVLEAAIERKSDIVLCMAQAPLTGRVLTELRSRGVITVLWFMEDYLRFTYWKEMAKFYDFVFTIQKGECIDLIKAAGAGAVHYIPMACDPMVHAPVQLTPEERERWGSPISFVGAGYHNRQQVFASFAEMPFKLWGTEWPECKPFDRMLQEGGRRLSPDEYVKIFTATDININLHSSTERDGVDPSGDFVNPRTFELAACGAFQLCDERSHLPELFEEGKEIITFSSVKDLKDKIAYYRERPDERRAIAERARRRVIQEHTYGHRLKDMLSIIYSSRYEHLKKRSDSAPWQAMLERSKKDPELHARCKRAYERGEEANLDGLVVDIMVGQGKLTETEQKLLFLYHVRKQIIRMKREETGQ